MVLNSGNLQFKWNYGQAVNEWTKSKNMIKTISEQQQQKNSQLKHFSEALLDKKMFLTYFQGNLHMEDILSPPIILCNVN